MLEEELKEKYNNYRDMIDYCCENLILNNTIVLKGNFDYYDSITNLEDHEEIYQFYIISESDAEKLNQYTNEIILYSKDLDVYLLGVTHFGTPWHSVPANWK